MICYSCFIISNCHSAIQDISVLMSGGSFDEFLDVFGVDYSVEVKGTCYCSKKILKSSVMNTTIHN